MYSLASFAVASVDVGPGAGGWGDGLLLRHAPHHAGPRKQQHAHHPLRPAQGRLQPAGQTVPRPGQTFTLAPRLLVGRCCKFWTQYYVLLMGVGSMSLC